jgi:hypothetical protein
MTNEIVRIGALNSFEELTLVNWAFSSRPKQGPKQQQQRGGWTGEGGRGDNKERKREEEKGEKAEGEGRGSPEEEEEEEGRRTRRRKVGGKNRV